MTEPEAVHQRAKDQTRRLAYKPVVVANAHGFIVGQRVEPSNEIAGLTPALAQHDAIFGGPPPTLLLDGGFASNALWGTLAEQGIDVLCPSGRTDSEGDWVKRSSRPGKFTKRNVSLRSRARRLSLPGGR